MEIKLLPQAEKDREYWKKTGNTRIMKRISILLADILDMYMYFPYASIIPNKYISHLKIQNKFGFSSVFL